MNVEDLRFDPGPDDDLQLPDGNARTYSTNEAISMTGVTTRQVYYWLRLGLIPGVQPRGSGVPLVWTTADVERLRELKTTLDEARRVIRSLGFS